MVGSVAMLEQFVADHLGPVDVLDRPVVRGRSRVVHVRDSGGRRWFAKRLVTQAPYDAEVAGHRLWAGTPGIPTPEAVCDERRCLLLPEVRGRQPSGQSRRVLRAAGAMLRTLHEAVPPPTWPSTWRELAVDDTDRRLAHLARKGVTVDHGLVRDHAALLAEIPVLVDVATHGDFQPHNWRWRRGRLHVFDFAGAGLRPAAYDLGRLRFAACWERPDLFEALLSGYGRELTPAEEQFIEALLPWRAVVAISLGLRHDRPEMVEHGHDVLARFAAS